MKLRERLFAMTCVYTFLFARGIGRALGYSLHYIGSAEKKGKKDIKVTLEGAI